MHTLSEQIDILARSAVDRLQAIRDGKPIRPETPAEMAAVHARHWGRPA